MSLGESLLHSLPSYSTLDWHYYTEKTKAASGERYIPLDSMTCQAFKRVIENRQTPRIEMMIDGHTGFLFLDKDGKPKVAGHLEHTMKRMVQKYNDTHIEQLAVTPHVLRHPYVKPATTKKSSNRKEVCRNIWNGVEYGHIAMAY